jgi:hypothetical protein
MNFWEFLDGNIFWILWVGFLVLAMYFGHKEEMRKPVHKVTNISVPSNAQLQGWYREVNRAYFKNELPERTTVVWADLVGIYQDMGQATPHPDGTWLITIDRATNVTEGEAKLTEAHEICHVATHGQEFDAHGPKFETCMVQLANQGAFKGLW